LTRRTSRLDNLAAAMSSSSLGLWPAAIDADGHVVESDTELLAYLPEPYRGRDDLLSMPFFPSLDGFHRPARRLKDGRDHVLPRPTAEDWTAYLDEANIAVSVLFPTAGLGFGLISDPEWAAALARGYNDWLADRFLRHDRRLKGMALLPLQSVPDAVAELERAVADEPGFVGGVLPAAGLPEAFGDQRYWPVYEAAQALDVPLAVHSAPAQGLGLDRLRKLIEVRSLTHPFGQYVQITSMLFNGVFDAFPRLRVAYCEAGAGWVPYLMERLDNEFRNRRPQAPALTVTPSEHIRGGRLFFHAELAERGLAWAVQETRDDIFFCASDYPHEPKDEFPEGLAALEARTDLTPEAKRNLVWNTPLRLYGLDEAMVLAGARRAAIRA
jgi:uncharacterized protein